MRLSTEADRDARRADATIAAALDAGITVFDTARAYGLGDDDRGHNERLVARVIARSGMKDAVRVVTKGGMRRPEGRWAPDGRAKSIVADCEASLAALEGLPIDLYLLHAPDPETPLATSVRALAQLLERGLVTRIGLSNVTASQLDEALSIAPIAAVETSLGWLDDGALKSGLIARCLARGVAVLAHRPLGGVKRRRGISRDEDLRAIADRHGATPARVALAALLDLHPAIVALPGATRPETALDAAAAADLVLDDGDRARLSRRLDRRFVSAPRAPETRQDGEVVLLMGLQGSGKTDAVASWVERGYERLSRDERGGTMKQLHRHLGARLAAGSRRVVLDNTYVVRATRREAIEVAWTHRLPVRGIWFDTPLAQAQVNVVLRMVRHHGRLLGPAEMAAAGGPSALPPHAQHRLLRQLESPALDEGYAALDVVPFRRRPASAGLRPARFVALDALVDASGRLRDSFACALGGERDVPRLVFGWRPDRAAPIDSLASRIAGAAGDLPVHFAECVHPAGPAICWCRPPMPGLLVAFAVTHGVDLSRSTLAGASPAHRGMAEALGAAYVE